MTKEEKERFALPLREAERVRQRILQESAAYLSGWEEGLFAPLEHTALHSQTIALFDGMERLAFWRGHRDGRSTREATTTTERNGGDTTAAVAF
jgi:CelD/BcsL family acetyltransferase involved in cellulose biosynthesis